MLIRDTSVNKTETPAFMESVFCSAGGGGADKTINNTYKHIVHQKIA